eukprot:Blabericola_migrator_1__4296@NODE_2319_length_2943_cov_262_305633_g1454_i0_p3_GENE_NODE_2319_length_2943_cov_262_305633_g1454_i0NODE_2319_length_2943_cov_262_305633_g1454_i0_p3_ORF_typecomplete_len132_score10_62_NODE_2319_length_2943_cov_262_305633_g1454_i023452740
MFDRLWRMAGIVWCQRESCDMVGDKQVEQKQSFASLGLTFLIEGLHTLDFAMARSVCIHAMSWYVVCLVQFVCLAIRVLSWKCLKFVQLYSPLITCTIMYVCHLAGPLMNLNVIFFAHLCGTLRQFGLGTT